MPKMLQTKLGLTVLVLLMVTLSVGCIDDSQSSSAAATGRSTRQIPQDRLAEDLDLGWLSDYQTALSSRESSPGSGEAGSSQAVAPYKQPSSWIINILKEFFDDIDWATIEEARGQIEKFIRKVDRLIGSVRSIISKATNTGSTSSNLNSQRAAATGQGRWWWGSKASTPAADLGADLPTVKGMLERVACFVGYVRLMNLSNEALAELDAAKVVSNLFSSVNKRNSSGWSWLG